VTAKRIGDCCEQMRTQLAFDCPTHQDPFDCPDQLVTYAPSFQEVGLIVHDGGRSSITIAFCPGCGTPLPASQRAAWFDELERAGIDDPEVQCQHQRGSRSRRPVVRADERHLPVTAEVHFPPLDTVDLAQERQECKQRAASTHVTPSSKRVVNRCLDQPRASVVIEHLVLASQKGGNGINHHRCPRPLWTAVVGIDVLMRHQPAQESLVLADRNDDVRLPVVAMREHKLNGVVMPPVAATNGMASLSIKRVWANHVEHLDELSKDGMSGRW
jgi:hypothetical protein